MRVVYCKYASLSKDQHELQATLNQGTQAVLTWKCSKYIEKKCVCSFLGDHWVYRSQM